MENSLIAAPNIKSSFLCEAWTYQERFRVNKLKQEDLLLQATQVRLINTVISTVAWQNTDYLKDSD